MSFTHLSKELSKAVQWVSGMLPQTGRQYKIFGMMKARKIFCLVRLSKEQQKRWRTPVKVENSDRTEFACMVQSKEDVNVMLKIRALSTILVIAPLIVTDGDSCTGFLIDAGKCMTKHFVILRINKWDASQSQVMSSSDSIWTTASDKLFRAQMI